MELCAGLVPSIRHIRCGLWWIEFHPKEAITVMDSSSFSVKEFNMKHDFFYPPQDYSGFVKQRKVSRSTSNVRLHYLQSYRDPIKSCWQ